MLIRRSLLVLVLFVGLVIPGQIATAQDPLAEARQAAEAARAEVEEAQRSVELAQTEANESAEVLFAAIEEREGLVVEIAELRQEIDGARSELDGLADEVRVVVINQYVDTQAGTAVLDEGDLNRGARADALSRYIARSRLDSVEEWRVVRIHLGDLETDLDARLTRQGEMVTELDTAQVTANARLADLTIEREHLEGLAADAEAEEARLIAEEEARQRAAAEAKRLAQEQARLEAEEAARRQAEEDAANQPNPEPTVAPDSGSEPETDPDLGGDDEPEPTAETTPVPTETPVVVPPSPVASTGWVCPVAGPTSFIDSWGAPRVYGRWHKGTDMMAATGIPVVAVVDGTVEHRGNSVGGLSAHLNAGDGTYFYYTHLSGYENEGAGFVSQGTVIGYVGMTGNAPVPHLHFEHHPGGRGNPVNPYPTLIASC